MAGVSGGGGDVDESRCDSLRLMNPLTNREGGTCGGQPSMNERGMCAVYLSECGGRGRCSSDDL